jgi:hypothetical protein
VAAGVAVRESPIEGLGVFATRGFARGELVLTIDDSRIVDRAHPLVPPEDPRHCDYLARGWIVLMQYPERHINHSCDPNVYVRTVRGRRRVIVLREIAPGEEIVYDYCINGYGDTVWTCRCGAARCRRRIHSDFFHLPAALQREYLPLLDGWFATERHREIAELQHASPVDRG